jgi:hypothetical protein
MENKNKSIWDTEWGNIILNDDGGNVNVFFTSNSPNDNLLNKSVNQNQYLDNQDKYISPKPIAFLWAIMGLICGYKTLNTVFGIFLSFIFYSFGYQSIKFINTFKIQLRNKQITVTVITIIGIILLLLLFS